MKPLAINGLWPRILPNHLAEWDALTGWERERFASMQSLLTPDMTLWDIGTEHGALSAVYAGWVRQMVLIEPGRDMWRNVYKTWQANNLPDPAFTFCGFVTDDAPPPPPSDLWPEGALDDGECDAMAYRSLHNGDDTPRTTIDHLAAAHPDVPVDAITMDVEAAELFVLRGAERTITEHRPIVWISVHPKMMGEYGYGYTADDVHAFMADHGYTAHLLAVDHEEHFLYKPGPA